MFPPTVGACRLDAVCCWTRHRYTQRACLRQQRPPAAHPFRPWRFRVDSPRPVAGLPTEIAMSQLSNAAIRDTETVIHPYTNLATHREVGPHVIERGEGVHVWDSEGRELIEGMSGLWCTSLGYGNEELVEVATEQMRKLSYTHIFGGKSHDPAIELAEKLKEIAPVPMSKVF